ncbi:MAG TPA: squalene/phytoene synthase family protein [Allosphingosinicella sp.]|nr:squalene/phytoene synthase family protein [Allosphingosinicella sp.]
MSSRRRRRFAIASPAGEGARPPLDPDRILALSYVPGRVRSAVRTLWLLDAQLGSVVSRGGDPMIRRLKLAWWRDALTALDAAPAPAEPLLQAVAAEVLPLGVAGAELAEMEEGWAVLLQEEALEPEEFETYASKRGALLFELTAQLMGGALRAEQKSGGMAWALADLSRHSGEPDASAALDAARGRLKASTWQSPLRPLGMLAALAARDAERGIEAREPQGWPPRMLRMLKLRITGR